MTEDLVLHNDEVQAELLYPNRSFLINYICFFAFTLVSFQEGSEIGLKLSHRRFRPSPAAPLVGRLFARVASDLVVSLWSGCPPLLLSSSSVVRVAAFGALSSASPAANVVLLLFIVRRFSP